MENPASCHRCSCLLFHRGAEDGCSQHMPSERAHTPSVHLHSKKIQLNTGRGSSQCRWGITPCVLPGVGSAAQSPRAKCGETWVPLEEFGLHLGAVQHPSQQTLLPGLFLHKLTERDGNNKGVSALPLGCFTHLPPSCLSLWSHLQGTSGSKL